MIGRIEEAVLPKQGLSNLCWFLRSPQGAFVLKVAYGEYRGSELWAEHTALTDLVGTEVPVPRPLIYARRGPISYHLRERTEGETARSALRQGDRVTVLRGMGATLAAIHRQSLPSYTWREWLDTTLLRAEQNLRLGAVDPINFPPGMPPEMVLDRLKETRPASGSVSLLHGDFSPKNLVVKAGRILSVIDWGRADFGDPYYDLAMAISYALNDRERDAFLSGYGRAGGLDTDRLWYFRQLAKFINL